MRSSTKTGNSLECDTLRPYTGRAMSLDSDERQADGSPEAVPGEHDPLLEDLAAVLPGGPGTRARVVRALHEAASEDAGVIGVIGFFVGALRSTNGRRGGTW